MAVSVSDDPLRIIQFWQAVEIFSPQTLPKLDPKNRTRPTVDLRDGAEMPWQSVESLPPLKEGCVWEHQVYGGLYDLCNVRDALVAGLGQEQDEEPKRKGKSALFACTIDEEGFLVPDTMVVSACAWGVGRVGRGKSVLGDFTADTQRLADSMVTRAKIRAGVRVLGEAVRNAVPDGIAAAVNAALTAALAPLGPVGTGIAATAQTAARSLAEAVVGTKKANANSGQRAAGKQDLQDDSDPREAEPDPVSITGDDLRDFTSWLADKLGVTSSLRPKGVRVQSRQIKIGKRGEGKAEPFLNSFLYSDLSLVAEALCLNNVGPALASYLMPDSQIDRRRRKNVTDDPSYALAWCQPHLIPPGRWVTATDRPLAFSQQFAVNRIMSEHGDGMPGMFAVNGPPGTGKTTMLRDLIAAIVVRRAEELAKFSTPSQAFIGTPHPWSTETYRHTITQLAPTLVGDEIVVASSNNAAVENITSEIPGAKGIDKQWHDRAAAIDYFAATAQTVTGKDEAWAMVAAILGNAENRGGFVTRFWFGHDVNGNKTGTGMNDALRYSAQGPSWQEARSAFQQSLREVQELSHDRSTVSAHLTGLLQSRARRTQAEADLREKAIQVKRLESTRIILDADSSNAAASQQAAQELFDAHMRTQPGMFAKGESKRVWAIHHEQLSTKLITAVENARVARFALDALDGKLVQARAAEQTALASFTDAGYAVRDAETSIADARQRWGDHLPAGIEYFATAGEDLVARRELSSPWADEEFSIARTELFLAALALHKAFILNARNNDRNPVYDNLNALTDMLAGKGRPKDPAAVLAAWQTLFLVVPVVSTTFASAGSMFAGLGRESLGWLLVDEAGQAAPQNAAGALWRCKRAVIVGDPLQLEPVVTLPWGGQRALLDQFDIGDEWAPSRSSVQQIADRLAVDGTLIPSQEGADVWVGAPLRVHRRCDRPMFKVSNAIAYHGLMVYGTAPEKHPFHGENSWIDVPSGGANGSPWIPAQGEMLRRVLIGLHKDGGVPVKEIRVISPYRRVAEEAQMIHKDVFPGVDDDDLDGWVGTVHKMQGREADAVILVLGGDPDKPGSRRFATEKPNLLNVAVTRARRRLYVIGDYQAWSGESFFQELKDPEVLRYYNPSHHKHGSS